LLGDASNFTCFVGFWHEPPNSDEFMPGGAALSVVLFVHCLVHKSLRLLNAILVNNIVC